MRKAWSMLKRLVRYFVNHGRLVQVISEQKYVKAPRVDTDSDYAGCELSQEKHDVCSSLPWRQPNQGRKLDARYTQFECGRVRVLRRSQKVDRLCWGAKSMIVDFGEDVAQCVLGTHSSSAKSLLERRGAGRIRHLHCPMPRLQERVDFGEMRTEIRKGERNTADVGNKAVTGPVLRKHLKTIKME